jgi:hypothetical protein
VPYRGSQKHPFSAHEGRPRQNSLSLIAANPHHFFVNMARSTDLN